MSNSDILLHDDRVEVIPTDGGGLTVSTGDGADPDAILRPNWATLTLGGGDGDKSDGDIKLRDRDGNTRIHIDGEGNGPNDPQNTQIWLDGRSGKIDVGKGSGPDGGEGDALGEIRIWGNYSGDNPGQPDIWLQGSYPRSSAAIRMYTEDNTEAMEIHPEEINLNGGRVWNASEVETGDVDAVDTATFTLDVGGFIDPPGDPIQYEPGRISVRGGRGFDGDQVETVTIEGGSDDGTGFVGRIASTDLVVGRAVEFRDEPHHVPGSISVHGEETVDGEQVETVSIEGEPRGASGGVISLADRNNSNTVTIRGDSSTVKLGFSDSTSTAGENGAVLIEDGSGAVFEVTAFDDVFSIKSLTADANLFEIDTDDEVVRTKYPIEPETL